VLNPLWVLAFLSVVGGLIGFPQAWADLLPVDIPNSHSLNNFLAPLLPEGEPHHLAHSTEYLMALGAVAMAALGFAAAWVLYVRSPDLPGRLAESARGLHALLVNKYYVDELYDAAIVRPLVRVSDAVLFRIVDAGLIDGVAVNGTARGVRAVAAHGLRRLQSGLAQGYVVTMIVGSAVILWYLLG